MEWISCCPVGLRQSDLFGPDADHNPTEDDSPLTLSTELAQLFKSDTEDREKPLLCDCSFCTADDI